ncbi:MAG TPA: hypothetical protein VKV26_24475 [Dehalococcoidia bacterium]|nr:hypothetical protein [Dehalococcoidia bacterium]
MEHGEREPLELEHTVPLPRRRGERPWWRPVVAAALAGMVLGVGSVLGWQQLAQQSAKISIAPPSAGATHGSRPRITTPIGASNPLSCTGGATLPIRLKGQRCPSAGPSCSAARRLPRLCRAAPSTERASIRYTTRYPSRFGFGTGSRPAPDSGCRDGPPARP